MWLAIMANKVHLPFDLPMIHSLSYTPSKLNIIYKAIDLLHANKTQFPFLTCSVSMNSLSLKIHSDMIKYMCVIYMYVCIYMCVCVCVRACVYRKHRKF